MGNPIVEEELQEAEKILGEYLYFRQYGADAGNSAKNVQALLDMKVEHFLRRSEPESAYYERFGDHDVAGQLKLDTFPDGCVCGQWSEARDEVHMISAPCYYTEV